MLFSLEKLILFFNFRTFRGYYTPNLKLAWFVCYLKIINTLKQILLGTKNGIEILVGQAVCKFRIKTVKILFWSVTHEPVGSLGGRLVKRVIGCEISQNCDLHIFSKFNEFAGNFWSKKAKVGGSLGVKLWKGGWATPFKIHTPSVEDFGKVYHRVSVNFQMHLTFVWFLD